MCTKSRCATETAKRTGGDLVAEVGVPEDEHHTNREGGIRM